MIKNLVKNEEKSMALPKVETPDPTLSIELPVGKKLF